MFSVSIKVKDCMFKIKKSLLIPLLTLYFGFINTSFKPISRLFSNPTMYKSLKNITNTRKIDTESAILAGMTVYLLYGFYDDSQQEKKILEYLQSERGIKAQEEIKNRSPEILKLLDTFEHDFKEHAYFCNDTFSKCEYSALCGDSSTNSASYNPSMNKIAIAKDLLIKAIDSTEGKKRLYAVLSHEMGHKEHNHALFYNYGNTTLQLLLPICNAISMPNTKLKSFTERYALAFTVTYILLGFIKRHLEFEADEFSARSFNGQYIDALINCFEEVSVEESKMPWYQSTKWGRIITGSSHPTAKERIERLKAIKNSMIASGQLKLE